MTKFINANEAAEMAGVTTQTIRNLAKSGVLKYKMRGNLFYVDRDEVMQYSDKINTVQEQTTTLDAYMQELDSLVEQKKQAVEKARVELINVGCTPERFRVLHDFMVATIRKYYGYIPENYVKSAELIASESYSYASEIRNVTRSALFQHWNKFLRIYSTIHADISSRDEKILWQQKTIEELRYKVAQLEGRKLEDEQAKERLKHNEVLDSFVRDYDLSVRCLNGLKAADIETIRDLVKHHRADLLKIRLFGKKSLTECDELLENLGLYFGMNV